jgi:hypothetical protein
LPLFTSGRVRLVDNKRLVAQFAGLERRTSMAGRDRVDHGPNGNSHDDISAAVAGALATLATKKAPLVISDEMLAQSMEIDRFSRNRSTVYGIEGVMLRRLQRISSDRQRINRYT